MRNSKSHFLYMLLWLAWSHSFGQANCNLVFSGRVVDATDGILIGAAVLLQPGNHGAVTDTDGHFSIRNLCAGTYQVEVQYLGYETLHFDQVLQSSATKDISLSPEATSLQEIVVEDHPDHLENVQNYVTLNEKQLEETAGKSLGETLKEIPGVNSIQTGPGIFKPVIHGVHSQRVLILNYGIRQEGQQWGAEHAPEIDPFIASNVTVVKDASAIKYGTDALGGVVIVNPPDLPTHSGMGGSLSSVMQSNGRSGTLSGSLEGGVKDHDGWGWRLQGTAKRSGDFHAAHYSLTNTGIKELDFSSAVGYHKKNKGAEVFFSHFQTTLGILKGISIHSLQDLEAAMERDVPLYTSGFSYGISEPRQEVAHDLLKVNGHMETASGEWRVQYGFQHDHRREYDIRIGGLSSIPALNLELNTQTLEAEWESTGSANRTLCVGMNGMVQNNHNVPGTQRIPFIPNFNNATGGLFAVSKWTRNRWVFDLGTRYDYRFYQVAGYDYKNTLYRDNLEFHNVSVTSGATVQIDNRQSFSVNLSSAWRPPHVAELYSLGTHQSAAAIEYGLLLNDTTNEVMNIKDVSFKVEKAVKWVNTYRYHRDNFQLEVTGYANYIFNYIYLKPSGVTENIRGVYPYFRYTQTDALFLGGDIFGSQQITPHLALSAKASLLRASDYTHKDFLIFIPSNRYELTLRYDSKPNTNGATFYWETKLKYVAHQSRAPRVITVRDIITANDQGADPFQGNYSNFDFAAAPAGYALVSIAGNYSKPVGNARCDFRLGVDNLLNTTYREYTNRFRYYANDLGRNITFSVKYIF